MKSLNRFFDLLKYVIIFSVLSSCSTSSVLVRPELVDHYHAKLHFEKEEPEKRWPKMYLDGIFIHAIDEYEIQSDIPYKRINSMGGGDLVYIRYHPEKNFNSFTVDLKLKGKCVEPFILGLKNKVKIPGPQNTNKVYINSLESEKSILDRSKMEHLYGNTFDLKLKFIDYDTDMPIIGAKTKVEVIPEKSNLKIFKKKYPYIRCPKDNWEHISENYTTDENGIVEYDDDWKYELRTNMDGSIKIKIYARANGRKPISTTIEEENVQGDLNYTIEWPKNPVDVNIEDDNVSPEIIKQ